MAVSRAKEALLDRAILLTFENVAAYLRNIIRDLKKDKGILTRDQINITRIDQTIRTLPVTINGLGMAETVRLEAQVLGELAREILAQLDDLGLPPEFSTESQLAIRIMMSGAEADLVALGGVASDALSQVLRRSIFGGVATGDLLDEIQTKLNLYSWQARTLAVTTVHAFHSRITVDHAKEAGVEWYVYKGPMDGLTREWCKHWINTRFRLEDLDKYSGPTDLERGKQPSPPSVYRGGWNCRHQIVPLVGNDWKKYPEGPK